MGSKEGKGSSAVSVVLFLLGIAFLAVAIVFSAMFLGPEKTDAVPFLKPGMQSTCESSNKGMLSETRVKVVNKTMDGLNLTTYVFNQRPWRTTYEDHVSIVFSGEKKVLFKLPMIEGAKVKYSIDVDTPTRILYRSWAKYSTQSAYDKKNLQQFSDEISITRTFSDAEFRLTAKKPMHGTFNLTARLPQWIVVPQQAIDVCREYPCKWKYSDYNWTKSSLWFITVNEGNGTAQVDAKNYYKFVFFPFPSHCVFVSVFHLFSCAFLDSPTIWVTTTVVLYVLFVICFVVGWLLCCL